MALSSTSRPSIRLKASVKIPASFGATGGLYVTKEDGRWTLGPDWSVLEELTSLPEPESKFLWVRDPATDVYSQLSVQALIDNLPIGPAGTITPGTVTTLAAGASATVANVGTSTAAILNFGIPRGADAGVKWLYETSTSMAAPATGGMRFNNASLASVTAVAVSATGSGSDVSAWVATWDDSTNTVKGYIVVREEASASIAVFSITSVTNNTTWLQLAVAYVGGSLSLTAADPLYVVPLRTGDKGADGAGTGDFVGPASSVDGEIVLFNSTTGKLGKRATTTGLLKASSGVLAAAVSGTDYAAPATTLAGYGITNGAIKTQTDFISGIIKSGANADFRIVERLPAAVTITKIVTKSASGTITLTWKLNTTAITTGVSSVTSTQSTVTPTAANVAAAGDALVATGSSNSSAVDVSFTVEFTRTLA